MTKTELIAVIGPVTTLLGALGGVGFTLRYQRGREKRDARQEAYLHWMQLMYSLDLAFTRKGPSPVKDLQHRKAELELLGSRRARQAAGRFMEAVNPVVGQIEAAFQRLGPQATQQQRLVAIRDFFPPLEPDRDEVRNVMRKDLGIRD